MARRRKGWLKRRFKLKLKKDAVYSISYILLFSLAFLIVISFSRQGIYLSRFNLILLDLFGWGVVFLPFFCLLSGLMLTRLKVPWNQAGVLVGGGLMAISLISLSQAGMVGRLIFEQVSFYLTNLGAYGILTASTLVGFIVFFNTSIDQIFVYIVDILTIVKGVLFRGVARDGVDKKEPKFVQDNKKLDIKVPGLKPEIKVKEAAKPITVDEEPEMPMAVNIPGAQNEVWNYPPHSLLSDSSGTKADRGDIKNNASVVERTLDSFGISARVVEVNGGSSRYSVRH